ncbi:MAG: hypothetical protein ACRC4N_01535, partial [Gammaproteobacteria bacterium]
MSKQPHTWFVLGVDKAYIYKWKHGHKSYTEGVHLSFTDTLTDFQPGDLRGSSFPFLFSPPGLIREFTASHPHSKKKHGFGMDSEMLKERKGDRKS